MVGTGKRPQVHSPLISLDCGTGVNINALLRRHAIGDVNVDQPLKVGGILHVVRVSL